MPFIHYYCEKAGEKERPRKGAVSHCSHILHKRRRVRCDMVTCCGMFGALLICVLGTYCGQFWPSYEGLLWQTVFCTMDWQREGRFVRTGYVCARASRFVYDLKCVSVTYRKAR